MSHYTVTLEIDVYDEDALFTSALQHAISENQWSVDDARELLRPDGEIDVGACLRMLLDPGPFPGDGATIEESASECILSDGDETASN